MARSPANQSFPEIQPSVPIQNTGAEVTGSTISRFNQRYLFNVFYQNSKELNAESMRTETGRRGKAPTINPETIYKLVIEEDLLTWYVQGYIIIQNVLESNSATNSQHGTAGSGSAQVASNTVGSILGMSSPPGRGDARDLLIIQIQPAKPDGSGPDENFPAEGWCLKYETVVYDTEDIPTEDPTMKLKKLYFRDLQYQLMTERNIQFSTATMVNRLPDGEALTSLAIKELLAGALQEPIGGGNTQEPISGNTFAVNSIEWPNDGAIVFYTSPAQYYAIDDLNYLLDLHVSTTNKNDMCLFTVDRFTKNFQLIPYSKLFQLSTAAGAGTAGAVAAGAAAAGAAAAGEAGQYQIEHFFIQNYSGAGGAFNNIQIFRAPLNSDNNWSVDTKLGAYSYIYNYRFVDMSGGDNSMEIINRPVCSYDFSTKTFHIEYTDNTAKSAKDYFKTNYVEKLYAKTKTPLMTLNQTKTKLWNTVPVWSIKGTKESRLSDGRNKTLFSAIYLNECINFNVIGSTNRQPGRFIGIDKLVNDEILRDFENKFLGQWLTTNVKHVFTKDTYINDILAVKIHSYDDLGINEEVP